MSVIFVVSYITQTSNPVQCIEAEPQHAEHKIQLTLVISTSLISNDRLSRNRYLVPIITWKSSNRL